MPTLKNNTKYKLGDALPKQEGAPYCCDGEPMIRLWLAALNEWTCVICNKTIVKDDDA